VTQGLVKIEKDNGTISLLLLALDKSVGGFPFVEATLRKFE